MLRSKPGQSGSGWGTSLQRGSKSWDRKVAGTSSPDEANPCFFHGSLSKFKTGKAGAVTKRTWVGVTVESDSHSGTAICI